MPEALGHILAGLSGAEAGRLLDRLQEHPAMRDAVFVSALRESSDPVPLIRLAARVSSPTVAEALGALAAAAPRLRGVIGAALPRPSNPPRPNPLLKGDPL